MHVAFRQSNGVGTRVNQAFAAQWLAYALPYRRFADAPVDTLTDTLVNACARLGADAVRYSFIVADFHRLLLAGLTGALLAPVSSTVSSAFPKRRMGRLPAPTPRITTSRRSSFEDADIS
jgi:hypothetical protein